MSAPANFALGRSAPDPTFERPEVGLSVPHEGLSRSGSSC